MARKVAFVAAVLLVGALGAMTAYGESFKKVTPEEINRETAGPRYMVKPAVWTSPDPDYQPPHDTRPIDRDADDRPPVTNAKSTATSASTPVSASAPLTPTGGIRTSRPAASEIRARVAQVMQALGP